MFKFKSDFSNPDDPLFVGFGTIIVDDMIQTPSLNNFNSLSIKRHNSGVGMELIKGKSSIIIQGGIYNMNRLDYYKQYYLNQKGESYD